MANGGRFEPLGHQIDGRVFTVPLLFDENRSPEHPYTDPLLRAAEIIAPTYDTSSRLEDLLGQVGVVLESVASGDRSTEGEKVDGLIIESDRGIGSVLVRQEAVVVAIREHPETKVPSELFFDMLHAWAQFIRG
jgi:hypothetical protein